MSVKPKIYIAYDEADKLCFEALQRHLQGKPFEVYSKKDLTLGENTVSQKEDFLNGVDLFIMMLSPEFIGDSYPAYKTYAITNHRKVKTIQLKSYDLIGDLCTFRCLHDNQKWINSENEKQLANERYRYCAKRIEELLEDTAAGKALQHLDNKETDKLYVLVVSSTKKDIGEDIDEQTKAIAKKVYGERIMDWKPYLTDASQSIGTILNQFKTKSKLPVQILPSAVYGREQLLRKERKNIIAIIDCLALKCDKEAEDKKDLARIFNESEVGGLILPICRHIDEATGGVLSKAGKRIFRSLRKLYYTSDDYDTPYLNIELNVPSEKDLLRKLINIASYTNFKRQNPKHVNWDMNQNLVNELHSFGDL